MMQVRRTLIVGLGKQSAVTLRHLEQQLRAVHGNVSVITTLLIDADDQEPPDAESQRYVAVPPPSSGQQPLPLPARVQVRQVAAEAIEEARKGIHLNLLRQRGIDVQQEQPMEMIIVGALIDRLVTAYIKDIAVTIYPEVRQRETINEEPGATVILTLPEGTGVDEDTKSRAYTTLQQIDQYLRRQNERGIGFDPQDFAIKQVYLLETNNTGNQGLSSPASLFPMIGDWLYHYLLGDLSPQLQVAANTTKYQILDTNSGFRTLGYASLFVPAENMITVLAQRFVDQVFANYLLANGDIDKETVKRTWEQAQLEEKRVVQQLAQNVPVPQMVHIRYTNIPHHRYEMMESQLAQDYNRVISIELPKSEPKLRENYDRLIEQARQQFTDMQQRQFHEIRGAIKRTLRFFQLLDDEWEQRFKDQLRRVQVLEREINNDEATIQQLRQQYWDIALTFGKPPFWFPISSMIIVLLTVSYVAIILWNDVSLRPFSIALPVLTLLALIIGFWGLWSRISNSKYRLIDAYIKRLGKVTTQHEARRLRQFYASLQTIVQQEYVEPLAQIKDRMGEHLAVHESTSQVNGIPTTIASSLFGTPRYELETSVIEPRHIEQGYQEAFGTTLDDEVKVFFSQATPAEIKERAWEALRGPLVIWMQRDPEQLRAALSDWVQHYRLNRIRTQSIGKYLVSYTEQQRKNMLGKLLGDAHVYSRINYTVRGAEQGQAAEKMFIGAVSDDKPIVDDLLKQNGVLLSAVSTTDPLRLVAVSVTPGLPLGAHIAVNYFQPTMQAGTKSTTQPLLYDPVTEKELSTWGLVSLSLALNVLKQDDTGFGYMALDEIATYVSENGNEVYEYMPLGVTLSEVVSSLNEPANHIHLAALQAQLVAVLQKAIQEDPSGRTLARLLDGIVKRSDIDEHARFQLREYIRLLLQRTAAKQQAMTRP